MPSSGHILQVDLPEQTPMGAPGGAYQNIPTSPNMFGAAPARAEAALGGGLEKAGQTGMSLAIEAQERQNDLYNVEQKSWYSDQLSTKHAQFMNLEGRAANDALDDYKKSTLDLKQQALSNVKSPVAQAKLAASLTNIQDQYWRYWAGHAGSQLNVYDKTVTGNAIASNASLAANAINAGDELGFQRALNNQDNEVRNYYSGQNYEPDLIEAEVKKRRGATLSTIIDTAADSGNVKGANALFDRFKDKMDPESVRKVTAKLKTVNTQTQAINIVDGELNAGAAAKPPADALHAKIDQPARTINQAGYGERLTGTITVNGHDYEFATGGGGRGSAPLGLYTINGLTTGAQRAASGHSYTRDAFPLSDKADTTPGTADEPMRTGLLIHSAQGGITAGCIGILGDQNKWQQFEQDMQAEIAKNGGRVRLNLGPDDGHVINTVAPITPATRAQALESVLNRPDLRDNPLLRNAVVSEINRRFTVQQATYADQTHQHQIEQWKQQEQYKQATDELLAGIQNNDPQWNSARVMSDPRFGYNREHALQLAQRPVMGEPDARLSAMTKRSLDERIGLPAGDPNKIQSEGDLYPYFSKLTTKDYDSVTKRVRDLHSEGGQRLAERRKEFLGGVKASFRGIDNLMGELQGDSGQQFDLFAGDLDQKIEQYKKEKKNPFDLMDPSKPDYMGATDNVNSYKRSLQQQLQDRAKGYTAPAGPSATTTQGAAAPAAAAGAAAIPAVKVTEPKVPLRQPGETLQQWLARTGRNPFGTMEPRQEQPQVPMSR